MGKSTSQANTTTSTNFTTTTTTNVGLSGNDVANIVGQFANYALLTQENEMQYLAGQAGQSGNATESTSFSNQSLFNSPYLLLGIGAILLILILR